MAIENIEDLYIAHFRLLFNYLRSIGCSKENAEDIIQNTFSKAVELSIHLEVTNISAWLFKVSLHQYYDLYRRNQRFPKANIDEEHFLGLFVQEEDAQRMLLQAERAHDITAVLDRLKPAYKNLLLLKYDLDLTYEQMSVILDMKIDTIRTSLYRARNEFKQKWSEQNERGF